MEAERPPLIAKHLVDLINFTSTRQQRLAEDELSEDTADGPHVDGGRVLGLTEKKLRSTASETKSVFVETGEGEKKRRKEQGR